MKGAPLFAPGSELPACQRRVSLDLQSSPGKSKNPQAFDLCGYSEAGGEMPFPFSQRHGLC
jgi:hypothetical protein